MLIRCLQWQTHCIHWIQSLLGSIAHVCTPSTDLERRFKVLGFVSQPTCKPLYHLLGHSTEAWHPSWILPTPHVADTLTMQITNDWPLYWFRSKLVLIAAGLLHPYLVERMVSMHWPLSTSYRAPPWSTPGPFLFIPEVRSAMSLAPVSSSSATLLAEVVLRVSHHTTEVCQMA